MKTQIFTRSSTNTYSLTVSQRFLEADASNDVIKTIIAADAYTDIEDPIMLVSLLATLII